MVKLLRHIAARVSAGNYLMFRSLEDPIHGCEGLAAEAAEVAGSGPRVPFARTKVLRQSRPVS